MCPWFAALAFSFLHIFYLLWQLLCTKRPIQVPCMWKPTWECPEYPVYLQYQYICQGNAVSASVLYSSFSVSQSSMGSLVPDSMVRRVYLCMCSIDLGLAAPTASGKSSTSAPSGVGREQLVVFLADTLRGTAEERAPLVMAMSHRGAGPATVVTCEQVAEVSRGHSEIGQIVSGSVVFLLYCFVFCYNPPFHCASSILPYSGPFPFLHSSYRTWYLL